MLIKKRGQVAVFIIIAILIVIGIILFFLYRGMLFPQRQGSETFSPESYLESCISPYIKSNLELQAAHGGFAAPEEYAEYNGDKVAYLCYTNEYFKTCVVQKPMIKSQVEKELGASVLDRAKECAQNLAQEYRSRGYGVELGTISSGLAILPGKISVSFIMPLTVTKDSSTQSFDRFDIGVKSEMYDMLMISENIVTFEAELGDSEISSYMQYYPDIKVEKDKISDGSKIYTVTNVVTNEKFRFASRSLVWSPGYGVDT